MSTQSNYSGVSVPTGHCVVNSKWCNSDLASLLKPKVKTIFLGDIGIVDFYPSSNTSVIYLTEGELLTDSCYKRRIVKLRNSVKVEKKYVFIEINQRTTHLMFELQKFVVINHKLNFFSVSGNEQAVSLLKQMIDLETRTNGKSLFSNTYNYSQNIDQQVLSLVEKLKGIGSVKAKLLLQEFKTIENIFNASYFEIADLAGKSVAKKIKNTLL